MSGCDEKPRMCGQPEGTVWTEEELRAWREKCRRLESRVEEQLAKEHRAALEGEPEPETGLTGRIENPRSAGPVRDPRCPDDWDGD